MSLTSTLSSLTTPLPLSLPVLPTAVTSVIDELESALPATLPSLALPALPGLPALPALPGLPALPVDLPVDLPLGLTSLAAPDALIAQLEDLVADLSSQLEGLLGALPAADLPALPGLGDLNALIDEIQSIVDATVVPLVAGGVDLLQDVIDGVQSLLADPSLNALAAGASDLLGAVTAATGGALVLLDGATIDPLLDLAAGGVDTVAATLADALSPVLAAAPQLAPVAATAANLLGLASEAVSGLNEAAAPAVLGTLATVNNGVALVDAALVAVDPLLDTLDGLAAGNLPALPSLPGLPAAPGLDDVLGLLPVGGGLPALPDVGGLLAGLPLDGGLPALPALPDVGGLLALLPLDGGLPALPDAGGLLALLPVGGGLPALPALDLGGLPSLPALDLGGLNDVPVLGDLAAGLGGLGGLVEVVDTVVDVANGVLAALPELPVALPAPVAGLVDQLDGALDPLLNLDSTSVGVSLDSVATADIALQLPLI